MAVNAPVTLPDVIVAGDVPVEVTVRTLAAFDPICTLPKLTLVALAESDGVLAPTPFPWMCTVVLLFAVALLVMVIVPVVSPDVFGLNFSFRDICWFGCNGRNGNPDRAAFVHSDILTTDPRRKRSAENSKQPQSIY